MAVPLPRRQSKKLTHINFIEPTAGNLTGRLSAGQDAYATTAQLNCRAAPEFTCHFWHYAPPAPPLLTPHVPLHPCPNAPFLPIMPLTGKHMLKPSTKPWQTWL